MSFIPVTGFSPKATSFCFKPLPSHDFLIFMGGKPLVSDQKDPKLHVAFFELNPKPNRCLKSSRGCHRAELAQPPPSQQREGVQRHSPASRTNDKGHRPLCLPADRQQDSLGVTRGHCRDKAPKEGTRAVTASIMGCYVLSSVTQSFKTCSK